MLHINVRSLFIVIFVFVVGCSPNYSKYASQYQFENATETPDYTKFQYWAAHPWKKDLSDSVPDPLKSVKRDSLVDVFFIHPTTYTKGKQGVNADVNDAELNAKTDYSTILYQSSVFNQHARLFAPRYRQMHLSQFFIPEEESKQAFDTAYADIKKAFEFYLANYHHERPIIIAGHSQGALMAERLIKEYFDGKPLQRRLIAAYIVGWPVTNNYFASVPVCSTAIQTGCFCSWRTFRKNFKPDYVKKEKVQAAVTNPLSWKTTSEYVDISQNKGGVLRNFSIIDPAVADAQIQEGVLWINKPKFKGSSFFWTKNYHIADINLYYMNIRENIENRIFHYLETH